MRQFRFSQVFLSKKPEPLPTLVDAATNKPWEPPEEGLLHITYRAEPHPPGVDMSRPARKSPERLR